MSTKQKKDILPLMALNLINEIYRGITDTNAWDDILNKLVQLTGSGKGIITLRSPNSVDMMPSQFPLLVPRIVNIDPLDVGSYLDHYYKMDPWTPFEAKMKGAAVIRFSELLQQEDLRKTVFYQEYLFPQQIEDGFALLLAKGADSWVILNLLIDSTPGMPPQEIKELLLLLAPHLQRAFCTALELSFLKSVNHDLSGLLDQQREGICLLDVNGRILFKNANATRLLEAQSTLYVKHGVLHSVLKAKERKLRSLIESACSDGTESGLIEFSGNDVNSLLQVHVTRYTQKSDSRVRSRGSVIVIISEPEIDAAIDAQTLKRFYSLTNAEAKLAASLRDGVNLKDYASNQAISFNTARWHLRNIFEKVGVNSQQELLRHLYSTPIQSQSRVSK